MAKQETLENIRTSENPGENLEQIRLILFGPQMQAFEQKLRSLEQRLQESTQQLNQVLLERITALENRLVGLLEQEAQERQIADQSLQGGLDAAVDSLEDKLATQMKETQAELKEQSRDFNKRLDQLSAHLQTTIEELRLQKADRAALADLLAYMADTLRKG